MKSAECNRAAPQYSILTKDYAKPIDMDINLEQFLKQFPIEKKGTKEIKTKIQDPKRKGKKGNEEAKDTKKSLLIPHFIKDEEEIIEEDEDEKGNESDEEEKNEEKPRQARIRKPNKKEEYDYDDDDGNLSSEDVLFPTHPQNLFRSPAKRERVDPNTPINKKDPNTFEIRKLNDEEVAGIILQRAFKKCNGINKRKQPCGANRKTGTKFCNYHQDQAKKSEK